MYVEAGASGRAIFFAAGRGDEKLPLLVALSLFDFDFDFNDDDTDDAEDADEADDNDACCCEIKEVATFLRR